MEERVVGKIGINNIRLVGFYFVLGYVAHIAVWIYKLGSHDANITGNFHIVDTWEFTIGRWFIKPVDWFNNYLSDPIFTSTTALLLFSIGAALVVNILELNDLIYRMICGGILMVSPCVAFSLSGFYCSADYALSFVLSCVFVYFIKKEKSIKNAIFATVVLVFSLGIYQAYLSTAAVLCLSLIILMLLKGETVEGTLIKGIYMMAVAAISSIIYYIIMIVIIKVMGLQVSAYKGADSLGKMSLLDLKIGLAVSYKKAFSYLSGFHDIPVTIFYRSNLYFGVILFIAALALAVMMVRNKIYRDPIRLFAIIGLLILFPIASGIILFISKGGDLHPFMIQSLYVLFVLFGTIVSLYQDNYSKERIPFVFSSMFLIATFMYGYEQYAINNATYEYNYIKRENVVSTAQRILTEAEELDGYQKDVSFCFAGKMTDKYPVDTYLENMSYQQLCSWESGVFRFNQGIIENIYRDDIGCMINLCNDDRYEELVASDEFASMPVYPEKGSIKMVKDCVIVKLEENPLMPSGGNLYFEEDNN